EQNVPPGRNRSDDSGGRRTVSGEIDGGAPLRIPFVQFAAALEKFPFRRALHEMHRQEPAAGRNSRTERSILQGIGRMGSYREGEFPPCRFARERCENGSRRNAE